MPQPPYDSKDQPRPDRSELPLQKRKCQTPPAEFLDRALYGGEDQRHKQSLKGRKWKWFREQVPPNRGTANEDQRNTNDQEGIPGRAATPEQRPPEKTAQTCEATVTGNKSERRDCRRVHGQEEERVVAGELANTAPIGSGRNMYKPRMPQAKPNEISRNGANERNGTRYDSFAEMVGGMFFFFHG